MGKTTKSLIDDIGANFVKAELSAAQFTKLKGAWLAFSDQNMKLLDEQISILSEKYNDDPSVAEGNADYDQAGKKVEEAEAKIAAAVTKLNTLRGDISSHLSEAGKAIGKLDAYLKVKEKAAKMPWKKKSVTRAKGFVADSRQTLAGFKIPPAIDG